MARSTKLLLLIAAIVALLLSFPLFAHLEGRPAPEIGFLTDAEYNALRSRQTEMPDSPVYGSLLISGEPAPYDAATNTFYVPEALESDNWAAALSWSNKDLAAFFAPDALLSDKPAAIAAGHAFTLLVSNGRRYHYETVVFTGLPAITLHTESEKSYVYEDGVPTGTLRAYYPTAASYEIKSSIATFRPRGNTTSNFDKTPLRLCLYLPNREKNYTSLIGMREDDDWILNSLYTDSSKLRDKLSIDTWNAIAKTNPEHDIPGARMKYVEVFLDDSYEGLYGLIEPIGKKSTGLDPATDILYQAKSFLLREEDFAAARDSLEFFALEIKYPKKWTGETVWDPITNFVDCFYWNNQNYSNEEMLSFLDLSNAVDHTLFLQAVTATDNFFHNTYFLAHARQDGSTVLTKIPWDLNYSFGDRWDDYMENLFTAFDSELVSSDQTTRDMKTLLEHEPSRVGGLLSRRWAELRQTVLSDARMEEAVQRESRAIHSSGAFARDGARWPDQENFDEAGAILTFVRARLGYLDKYYAAIAEGGAQ